MTAETPSQALRVLGPVEIQATIPHRYPFLLVDQVEILEEGRRAIGTKCVTMNEHFFEGHFPGHPIMPGVLILEAMAQAACVLMLSKADIGNKIAYFLGIESAKFRQPVRPGAVLKLHVEITRAGSRAGKFKGEARIGNDLACEAEMSFAIVDK